MWLSIYWSLCNKNLNKIVPLFKVPVPWNSEVIGRCGEDVKTEWAHRNDKNLNVKKKMVPVDINYIRYVFCFTSKVLPLNCKNAFLFYPITCQSSSVFPQLNLRNWFHCQVKGILLSLRVFRFLSCNFKGN